MKLLSLFQSIFGLRAKDREVKAKKAQENYADLAPMSLLSGETSWSVWPAGFDNPKKMLQREVEYANAKGLKVVLYTYAAWCPGSAIFKKLRKDPGIVEAFQGVHLIEVGYADDEKISEFGMDSGVWPQFFRVNEQGDYNGTTITGDAWGADTSDNIAKVMKDWVRSLA